MTYKSNVNWTISQSDCMAITTTTMAVRLGLFCLIVSFFTVYSEFVRYNRPIVIETKEDCNQAGSTKEFYDITKLECVPCSENVTYQVASADRKLFRHVRSR